MVEILSTDQIEQLRRIAAGRPYLREDLLATIDQLSAAQKQAESATAELRKQEAANQAVLDEASQKLMAAQKLAADFEAEKREFESVRQNVDREHRDREASLSQRAAALSQLKADLAQHAAELADREAAVVDRESKNAAERQLLDELHEQHNANVAKYKAATAALTAAGG